MDNVSSPLINPTDSTEFEPTLTGKNEMDVDEVIAAVGGFGRYQFILLIICMCSSLSFSYQTLSMYFVADDPPWQCTTNATSEFCMLHRHQSIPESSNDFHERCNMSKNEWEYTKPPKYSLVTEFNLVCKKEYLKALTTSSFFIGCAVGSIVSGPITDAHGRKLIICMSLFLNAFASFTSSFITAIWQMIILRVLIGCAFGGACMGTYILLSECNTSKNRGTVGNIYFIGFTMSQFLVAGVAYWERDWRLVLLYLSFTACVSFILSLVIYESPNWLFSKGKTIKSVEVLIRISKMNKKPLTNFTLKLPARQEDVSQKSLRSKNYSYIDLFNNRKVFSLVAVQGFLWMAVGLMFYGIALESSNLGGDIYFNFALSSLADVPGYIFVVLTSIHVKRKKTICISFIISSAMISAIGFVPERMVIARIALAVSSRIVLNVTFNTLYLWSFEIFPTILRSQGMNICQIMSRTGSAVAPFVTEILKNVNPALPFFIMGGVGVISTFIGVILPETKNKPIRQTYHDMLGGNMEVTTTTDFEE